MQTRPTFFDSQSDDDADSIFEQMRNELYSKKSSMSKLYDFDFEDGKPFDNPKRYYWEKETINAGRSGSDSSSNTSCN